uniref:BHLH domain-containing protein n=1 Tax=Oryza glumipatula TaxID=40148 RepID=A0A0D9YRL6_9ORYZ
MDPRSSQAQEDGFFHPRDGACPADSSGKTECKTQGSIATRKVQKADHPDRPRNDKATILSDAIQMLKDLTSQVNKLKAEYTSLSEEARELTQEKNELRDEKVSLKFEVDNLNTQYQQRMRVLYPWTGMEPSVVIGPPLPYPFSVPVPVPIPSVQHSSSNRSHSMAQDSRSKSSALQQVSCRGKHDDFDDVATDLELKTPGSSAPLQSEIANKDSSSDLKKKQQFIQETKGSSLTEGSSSSSRCSSSGPPDVSNSIEGGLVADDQRSTVQT